jgi:hypothetical protein
MTSTPLTSAPGPKLRFPLNQDTSGKSGTRDHLS